MAKINYVKPANVVELEKLMAKAVRSVEQSRVAIQVAAVATLMHANEHGDWRYAGKLVDALGNTINGGALVKFFVDFGGLTIEDGAEGFTGWQGKEFIQANFQKAKETMWWSLKVKSPYKGFDLEAALQKVLSDTKAAQAKIDKLPEDEKGKIRLMVNDATIRAVLKLANFDAIIDEADLQASDVA